MPCGAVNFSATSDDRGDDVAENLGRFLIRSVQARK